MNSTSGACDHDGCMARHSERSALMWPRRVASACAFLLEHYSSPDIINIGCGWEISIREAAEIIRDIIGFQGEIRWDTTQPDGNPRRLLDVSRMKQLGWQAAMNFREGVASTYQWFLDNRATART